MPVALLEATPQTDNNDGNSDNNDESLGGHKTAISIIESTSKIYKPKAYNKAINDPINGKRWREAIKKKLQNPESHYSWKYKKLFPGQKAI